MSYANWLTVSPTTGSGNGTVSVSTGSEHSGRVARSTTLTITAANVADQTVTVNQAGKPEYVDAPATATAVKPQSRADRQLPFRVHLTQVSLHSLWEQVI